MGSEGDLYRGRLASPRSLEHAMQAFDSYEPHPETVAGTNDEHLTQANALQVDLDQSNGRKD